MKDQTKTRQTLIGKLASLKERIAELEQSELKGKQADEALLEFEAKLKEAEETYRNIFMNSQTGLFRTEIETGIMLEANDSLARFAGFENREALLSSNFNIAERYVHPDARKKMLAIIKEQGQCDNYETRFRRNDGSVIWIRLSTKLVPDKGWLEGVAEDITAGKLAEDALRESEEKYRILFENASEAIFVAQDGKVVFLNPTTAIVTGYSNKEFVSRPFVDFIHQDDRNMVMERYVRRLNGEDIPRRYSFRILHKNGGFRWVELDTVLINWKGRPATLNFLTDITERKRVEETLQKSEERYRSLVENAHEAILVIQDGIIKFVNTRAIESFGYSVQEFLSIPVFELVHPEDRNVVIERYLQKINGDTTPTRHTYRSILKGGHIAWIEISSVLIDWEGRPATLNLITDITERKQAEEKLRESQERLLKEQKFTQLLLDTSPAFIVAIDFDGKTLMMNRSLLDALEYTAEQIKGTDYLTNFVPEEDRMKLAKVFQEIIQKGNMTINENHIISRSGRIYLVEWHGRSVTREKGSSNIFVGVGLDITDRKNSMDQLRKALGGTVLAIALVVESKDPYTAGHQRRVADISRAIATEMGLSQDQIEGIRMAGIIHDIGKVSVPAEILSMPRKLTDLEFSLIKTHAQSGYEILKDIEFPWPIARMVLEHHERMNGSGYPNGLTGDKLLPESRILAVADVVEAMATYRPYRAALGLSAALEEIAKNRGILYDPEAVDACLRLFREKGFSIKG
jgi:PAS domain S-box-containing protein/putative nucleotidyltransferase with HDIG domain